MKNLKLSVVIPAFEQQDKIEIGLNSIPVDSRIETIVVDDGSKDHTKKVVEQYIKSHPEKNIRLYGWKENRGVSAAVNKGLDESQGEYVVILGSDGDYFLPKTLEMAMNIYLNNYDLVFFDLIDNNKHIRKLNPQTAKKYVGTTKFMRRDFIEDIRCPLERRRAEDVVFTQKLLAKKPTMFFTHKVMKHYNYPREGSLTWNARHGVTDSIGNPIKKEKKEFIEKKGEKNV